MKKLIIAFAPGVAVTVIANTLSLTIMIGILTALLGLFVYPHVALLRASVAGVQKDHSPRRVALR